MKRDTAIIIGMALLIVWLLSRTKPLVTSDIVYGQLY